MSSNVARGTVPVERQPWSAVVKGLFLGLLTVTAVFIPSWFLLELAGVPLDAVGAEPELGRWPYNVDGAWSLVANLTIVGLALAMATKLVRHQLAAATGAHVSGQRTAMVLAATMPLPLVSSRGLLGVTGLLAVLVAVVAVRFWVVGRGSVFRPPRALVAALLVSGSAGLCALAGYVVTHPFTATTRIESQGAGPILNVQSRGRFSATITGISVPHFPPGVFPVSAASLPLEVRPRGTALVFLRLPGCSRGRYDVTIDRLALRYTLLGHSYSEILALAAPWRLRCGG